MKKEVSSEKPKKQVRKQKLRKEGEKNRKLEEKAKLYEGSPQIEKVRAEAPRRGRGEPRCCSRGAEARLGSDATSVPCWPGNCTLLSILPHL